ncbi:MAG: hypothetical protein JST62_10975 [Bacteroidetes bacterium]|nr:hypothetical protein [Bacteroidota bacterium]
MKYKTKNSKHLKLIIFLLLFVFNNLYSQQNKVPEFNFDRTVKIFPPSPNAAALAKYAEVPVSLNTGIPQISIPIFSWGGEKSPITLEVNLSYFAGGIKVEDVPSNAGLNWSLNAGGVITRSVRGLPDESFLGYINQPIIPDYNTTVYQGDYYLNPASQETEIITMNVNPLNIIAPFNNQPTNNGLTYQYYKGFYDTEQDVFYYNFQGYSGKFVIDKNREINKFDLNDLDIQINFNPIFPNQIDGFTIITNTGLKYDFHTTENSNITSITEENVEGSPRFSQQNTSFISSFFLTSIKDHNSEEEVNFAYESRNINYLGGWSESSEFQSNQIMLFQNIPVNKISSTLFNYSKSEITTPQIKEISLPNKFKINFYYDTPRQDVAGDKSLDRIEIVDQLNYSKKYILSYDYYLSPLNPNLWSSWHEPIVHPELYKRLRLKAIHQVKDWNSSTRILINKFDYNDIPLPPRDSKEIDFWGYYYGNNRYPYTLIPQIFPEIIDNPQQEGLQSFEPEQSQLNIFSMGSDRRPDADNSQAGILRKLYLPTGGYTQFDYESNTVEGPIYYNSNIGYVSSNSTRLRPSFKHRIKMNERNLEGVMFLIEFKRVNNDGSIYVQPPPTPPYTCIGDLGNASISFIVTNADNSIVKVCEFAPIIEGDGRVKIYFNLPLNEEYFIHYSLNNFPTTCGSPFYYEFNATAKYNIINTSSLAGGIRIKEIKHFDPTSGKELRTVYDYLNDNNISSGQLPVIPNYQYTINAIGIWNCCDCDNGTIPILLGYQKYKTRTSSSTQTLGFNGGANVNYKKVTFYNVDEMGNKLGKTETKFSEINFKNYNQYFPYTPIQVIDWNSGNKMEEKIFDKNDKLLSQVNYDYYTYSFEAEKNLNRSVKIACIRTDNCVQLENTVPFYRYVAHTYYPYSGRTLLKKTTTKLIDEFLNESIGTEEFFYYNNTSLLRKTVAKNSKGYKTINKYYYAADFTSAPALKLVSNKVSGKPVSIRSFIQKTVSGSEEEIKGTGIDFEIIGNFSKEKFFSTLATESPLINPLHDASSVKQQHDIITGTITKRDAQGNVIEFKGRDELITSIIYSYNFQYPSVKIVGKSIQEVLDKVSSFSPSQIPMLNTDADLETLATEIRNGFASDNNVQIYSYTYLPIAGIKTQTDLNGKTIYYNYDEFFRLKNIMDNDLNILKQYEYSYNSDCSPTNCTAEGYKCIESNCVKGIKIYTNSVLNSSGNWLCTYHYKWADGSQSGNYNEISEEDCSVYID